MSDAGFDSNLYLEKESYRLLQLCHLWNLYLGLYLAFAFEPTLCNTGMHPKLGHRASTKSLNWISYRCAKFIFVMSVLAFRSTKVLAEKNFMVHIFGQDIEVLIALTWICLSWAYILSPVCDLCSPIICVLRKSRPSMYGLAKRLQKWNFTKNYISKQKVYLTFPNADLTDILCQYFKLEA